MHVADMTMNNRLHHVDHEEEWNRGEYKSHKVTRETDVDHTVAFERAECFP